MSSNLDAVELTRQLVQIESTDPGLYEGAIEWFIRDWLQRRIAKLPASLQEAITLQELEVAPGRAELMATIPAKSHSGQRGDQRGQVPLAPCHSDSSPVAPTATRTASPALDHGDLSPMAPIAPPRLVFICHMDTVVIGEGWDKDINPLGAEVRNDRIYGRGACDMKSGLACALTAFAQTLEEVAQKGALPKRGLSVICTVDEEAEMRGVEAAIEAGWVGKDDWVMDCEPTDNQLQIAHKGRTWFELSMTGVTAHASKPEQGADAIAAMAEAISYIRHAFLELPEHYELGRSTVTFGQIEGGYQPYVVPDKCTCWIDMRLVPPCGSTEAEAIVQKAIRAAEEAVLGNHGSYTITGDRPPIERDPGSPFAAAIQTAAEQSGYPTTISTFTGYTDTAVIAGKCGNHNCMSYGPGSLGLAHKPNEYVDRSDVIRVQAVLNQLCRKLLW